MKPEPSTPQGLEPPTGRRALRAPTALILGLWTLIALLVIGRYL